MTTNRTAKFQGQTFTATRKDSRFMSFYALADGTSEGFLTVEHRSENAARKGSWQSAGMKAVWIYQGYSEITEG